MTKKISVLVLLALALWSLAGMTPNAHSKGASSVAQTAVQGQLGDGELRQMLDNMGYEPKALTHGFLIAVKRDTWTINIQLRLSDDKTKIGFNANLGVVENPDAVTAKQWMDLLVANGDIDPSSFYFDKEQKKLYMHRVIDNHGLTPAYLRLQIENFCGNVKDTNDLWKFTK